MRLRLPQPRLAGDWAGAELGKKRRQKITTSLEMITTMITATTTFLLSKQIFASVATRFSIYGLYARVRAQKNFEVIFYLLSLSF